MKQGGLKVNVNVKSFGGDCYYPDGAELFALVKIKLVNWSFARIPGSGSYFSEAEENFAVIRKINQGIGFLKLQTIGSEIDCKYVALAQNIIYIRFYPYLIPENITKTF